MGVGGKPLRWSDCTLPGWPRCVGLRQLGALPTSSRRRRCSMRRFASSALHARRVAATTARLRTAWAYPPSSPSGWTCSVSWNPSQYPGPGACPWGLRLGRRSGEMGGNMAPPWKTMVETLSSKLEKGIFDVPSICTTLTHSHHNQI